MAKKNVKTKRNVKVLEQSGYKYKPTPAIMLKGQWLAEFGFNIATQVQVQWASWTIVKKKDTFSDHFSGTGGHAC